MGGEEGCCPGPVCPQIEPSPFPYLMCIQRLAPAGYIAQVHPSADVGLVSANRRETLLGHEGVGSQAISPHSSFQKQGYLFCVCNPRFH